MGFSAKDLTKVHNLNSIIYVTECSGPDSGELGTPNWTRVMFSDELKFNVIDTNRRIRVYRRVHKRYIDHYIDVLERDRFGRDRVSGLRRYKHYSQLVILYENSTAQRYIDDTLQPLLAPLIQQHRQDTILVFQQDNARAYTARLTRNIFQRNDTNVLH